MDINWSKVFDWSVTGVQAPYALNNKDGVFAYCVDVMYRHHGFRRVVFPVERDRVYVTGRELALSQATHFFNKIRNKMQTGSKAR